MWVGEKDTDKQAQTDTDRHRQTQKDTERHRQTQRDTDTNNYTDTDLNNEHGHRTGHGYRHKQTDYCKFSRSSATDCLRESGLSSSMA